MAEIIDGKVVSAKIKDEVRVQVDELRACGIFPCLAVILVGNDPASCVYVKNKQRACEATGIIPKQFDLPEDTTEDELIALINELNCDTSVHGILVQLPLPAHICQNRIIESISAKKDVDAFSHESIGRIMEGNYGFLPCTPAGVMELLDHYNVDVCGKDCVVVGRSNIVGKPMAMLLLNRSATVTVCHSKTKNLAEVCSRADVIVCAVGKADFLRADMVKEGAVVIDVGINRTDNGLVGDVKFDEVSQKASMVTPVPGGVGPMTIAMLMKNTVKAAKGDF